MTQMDISIPLDNEYRIFSLTRWPELCIGSRLTIVNLCKTVKNGILGYLANHVVWIEIS